MSPHNSHPAHPHHTPHADHGASGDLVQTLRAKYGHPVAAPPSPTLSDDPVLDEFIRSMLLWESTTALADEAWRRLIASVVDANELRVCSPREIAGILGPAYPLVHDRSERLHAALTDAFRGTRTLTQASLAEQGKREARGCLEAIEGTPGFVAARVVLLQLGGHAAPVDGRLLRRMVECSVVPRGRNCTEAATLVERHVRAGELLDFYMLAQAWADDLALPEPQPAPPSLGKAAAREPAAASRSRPPRPGGGRGRSEKS